MTTNPRKPNKPCTKYQKKKVKPAHKSMRGVPETDYGEIKKTTCFSLTPTAYKELKEVSQELGISASELIERLARKKVDVKNLIQSSMAQKNVGIDVSYPLNKA